MHDPTIEDMRAFLIAAEPEADEFDREEAIYWFAADWHGGQASNLYAALSASQYEPGPLTTGPSGMAVYCYNQLENKFATNPTE